MLIKKSLIRPFLSAALCCLAGVFTGPAALAHRMTVELEGEENTVMVGYDTGHRAAGCKVKLYDRVGTEIHSGRTDKDGIFVWPSGPPPYRIVADDGMGHRAVWRRECTGGFTSAVPLRHRALLGAGIFLFIAAFFYYRNSLKKR